jgi:hypothetical protein
MIDALVLCTLIAQTPLPFPRVGQPKPEAPPGSAAPATDPQRVLPPAAPPAPDAGPAISTEKPSVDVLGVQIYPGAAFLASYDAGRGQRYYLFGANAAFDDIVSYYRTVLKQKGELIYEQPLVQEFDIGRYREETMAFPPSVTIKDYSTGVTQGYLYVSPGQPARRFKTIIQVVPASPGG